MTEADSAWQLIQALNQIHEPGLKARLFHNAMEEMNHAELFTRLADRFSVQVPHPATPPRRQLFADARSVAAFEAYHYVGELDVFEQFSAYARAAPPGPVRDTFLLIRADEEGHQLAARADLVQLAGSEAQATKLVRKVRLERFVEALSRGANAVGDVVSTLLLAGVFVLFGPFMVLRCRRKLKEASWTTVASDQTIEVFKMTPDDAS
ncbi:MULTISPECIES: ferritin-like domain-containing protein [unclassified Bradyrhizobium]|uniref:ferritin-like domain-containing protein n=1 Tax=unclassified Bradyrhizobium TaxID=2631580 RepID=UPI002916C9AA|nr:MULTISPECIES: ferritin-like domain-containing protein [unclassified Bradyrhizobium]